MLFFSKSSKRKHKKFEEIATFIVIKFLMLKVVFAFHDNIGSSLHARRCCILKDVYMFPRIYSVTDLSVDIGRRRT